MSQCKGRDPRLGRLLAESGTVHEAKRSRLPALAWVVIVVGLLTLAGTLWSLATLNRLAGWAGGATHHARGGYGTMSLDRKLFHELEPEPVPRPTGQRRTHGVVQGWWRDE